MPRRSPDDTRDLLRKLIALVPGHTATSLGLAIGDKGHVSDFLGGRKRSLKADAMLTIEGELGLPPGYLMGARSELSPEEALIAGAETLKRVDAMLANKPLPKREDRERLTRVYASAEGGEGAVIVTSDPVAYEPRPNILPDEDDLYGVVMEGTSMGRAYRPGDTVWIHPRYRERRDEPCVFRSFNEITGEAKATLKWLVDFNSERWVVEQFNPEKKFELSRKDWPDCYRVLGKKNRL